ncbi:hypothetical protein ACIQU4_26010 [Streptomyces sp. NPDC090741]|uniref:hypothetical protein n=1 Tax=Streptomyces sp. NPDC090741 TaxID=3365967 RepID=UPI0037F468C7
MPRAMAGGRESPVPVFGPITKAAPRTARDMDDFFAGVLTRAIPWPVGQADLHWHILHDPLAVEEQLAGPYL